MGLTHSSVETITSDSFSSMFHTIQMVDQAINTCSNKLVKTISNSYVTWVEKFISSTVNEYSDCSMTNNIVLDPEISQVDNESFDMLLDEILLGIYSQLDAFGKNDNIRLNVGIKKDIEDPDWEEFVISIKILPKNVTNYEKYYNLLDKIIEEVRSQISSSGVQDDVILEKYGDPIIVFDVCE